MSAGRVAAPYPEAPRNDVVGRGSRKREGREHVAATGEGAAGDSRPSVLCACGCGRPIPEHYTTCIVIRGHGTRRTTCEGCGQPYQARVDKGRWTTRHFACSNADPRKIEAGRKSPEKRLVPSEPVFRVLQPWLWKQLAAQGGWPHGTLSFLGRLLGQPAHQVQQMLTKTRIARDTAERLLAIVAGLPRSPTLGERRAAQREYARIERRKYRREAG